MFGPIKYHDAMSSLHNQVHLIGRAGHAVSLIHLTDGTPLARLRLYQREYSPGRQSPTQAHALVAWRETATQLHRLVGRGDRLLVQGRLVSRRLEREGRIENRYEIHINQFTLLGRETVVAEAPCLNEPQPSQS